MACEIDGLKDGWMAEWVVWMDGKNVEHLRTTIQEMWNICGQRFTTSLITRCQKLHLLLHSNIILIISKSSQLLHILNNRSTD